VLLLCDLFAACRSIHLDGVKRDRSARSRSKGRSGDGACSGGSSGGGYADDESSAEPTAAASISSFLPTSLAALAATAVRRNGDGSDWGGLLPQQGWWQQEQEQRQQDGEDHHFTEAAPPLSAVSSPLQPRSAPPAPFQAKQQQSAAAAAAATAATAAAASATAIAYDPQQFAGDDTDEGEPAAWEHPEGAASAPCVNAHSTPWDAVLAKAAAATGVGAAAAFSSPGRAPGQAAAVRGPPVQSSPAAAAAAQAGVLSMRQLVLQQQPRQQQQGGLVLSSAVVSPAQRFGHHYQQQQHRQQGGASPATKQHALAAGDLGGYSNSLQLVAVPDSGLQQQQQEECSLQLAAGAPGQLQGFGSWGQLKGLLTGLVARLDEAESELAIHKCAFVESCFVWEVGVSVELMAIKLDHLTTLYHSALYTNTITTGPRQGARTRQCKRASPCWKAACALLKTSCLQVATR